MKQPQDLFGEFIIDGTKLRISGRIFQEKKPPSRFRLAEDEKEKNDSFKMHSDEEFFINAIIEFFENDIRSKLITDLNLKNNALSHKSISKLAALLEKNKTIRKLKLCDNECDQNGMISLAKMLENNTTLEVLNISFKESRVPRYGDTDQGNKDIKALAKALTKNSSLQVLKLTGCYIRKEGCIRLVNALHGKNFTLRELHINRSEVKANGLEKSLIDLLERNHKIFIQAQGTMQALRKFGHFAIPSSPQNFSDAPPSPLAPPRKRNRDEDTPPTDRGPKL